MAWEASYIERGLTVPETGPREGYWGSRTNPKEYNDGLLVRERKQLIPGLVAIDDQGMQHVGQPQNPKPHILIIGNSVAFGAYASAIEKTYFSLLLHSLKTQFPSAKISVMALGGSMSDDDLAAFALRGVSLCPDIVVFLNGLNDLVNPGGTRFKTYVRKYLKNMKIAQHIAGLHKIRIVFALQPFLGTKKNKTTLEQRVLELSRSNYEEVINPYYEDMVEGLRQLAKDQWSTFIDCSGVSDNEKATTFADQWHFSDPGHELLATKLAEELLPLLREIEKNHKKTE
jgi:lysophospholipase L1-like esterase